MDLGNSNKPTNVVILGKEGVGKTTIFNQLSDYFDSGHSEIGSIANRLVIKNDKVNIIVCDIKLPAALNTTCMKSVSRADAFILVYDVSDADSFEYIENIKDYLIEKRGPKLPVTFVGNKTDLPERSMRFELADCLVSIDWEMNYLEVSAITEDTVPAILTSIFIKKKHAGYIPSDGDLDIFELRGMVFRPRAKTESSLPRPNSRLDAKQEAKNALIESGILPKTACQGRFRRILSLQNLNFFKTSKRAVNTAIENVEPNKTSARHPTVLTRLLMFVKPSDSLYRR